MVWMRSWRRLGSIKDVGKTREDTCSYWVNWMCQCLISSQWNLSVFLPSFFGSHKAWQSKIHSWSFGVGQLPPLLVSNFWEKIVFGAGPEWTFTPRVSNKNCRTPLYSFGGFLSHRGTPRHHPFLFGIFPEINHPSFLRGSRISGNPHLIFWLVVWLPFFLFSQKYWVSNHPNWRTLIFFRGVAKNPPTSLQVWPSWHPSRWRKRLWSPSASSQELGQGEKMETVAKFGHWPIIFVGAGIAGAEFGTKMSLWVLVSPWTE